MQAIQARSPCSSRGTSPERVRSARPMLPPGRSTFIRKGAEGTFADHRIKLAIGKSEMLRVPLLEAHAVRDEGLLSSACSFTHQLTAVLDPDDLAVKALCQEDGAGPLARSYVQHSPAWS